MLQMPLADWLVIISTADVSYGFSEIVTNNEQYNIFIQKIQQFS